jgi:hypothetical protein
MQHHVERRDAAGAGETIAVDGEELIADQHARKLFAQRREIFPVNGGVIAVEQPGLGQRVSAGAERAELKTAFVESAQRCEQCR